MKLQEFNMSIKLKEFRMKITKFQSNCYKIQYNLKNLIA